jgi:hypothetical protein
VSASDVDRTAHIRKLRDRLNLTVLFLPGQWLSLMVVFWMRFVPCMRPFAFHTPAPALAPVAACLLLCLLPLALPRAWFRTRAFERGSLYPALGLRLFRFVAPDGDFVNSRLRRIDPSYRGVATRAALIDHLSGTLTNERSHLVLFLLGTFTQAFAFFTGEVAWAAVLAVFNLAFNLYPVMHQRYKRARAKRTLKALGSELGIERPAVA